MRFLMALPAPPEIMEKIVPSLELVTAMRKYDQEDDQGRNNAGV